VNVHRAAAASLLLPLAGCAGFDTGYSFQPAPAVVPLRAEGAEVGRIEATVEGALEGSGAEPATVHVKVRVERRGPVRVAAPPDKMFLFTADGRWLGVHTVDPPDPRLPAAGGAATFVVAFAVLRPADLDDLRLSRLDLYVEAEVGEERQVHHVLFERELRDHPWWNPWGPGPE
jgi:hypothetical protein